MFLLMSAANCDRHLGSCGRNTVEIYSVVNGSFTAPVPSLPSVSRQSVLVLCCRERRPTWAEERRLNAETFGIPLRPNRGRGGFRGRGVIGFRGGRGRGGARGGFTAPRGFRGGFRGGRGGREFADFEYRVKCASCSSAPLLCSGKGALQNPRLLDLMLN